MWNKSSGPSLRRAGLGVRAGEAAESTRRDAPGWYPEAPSSDLHGAALDAFIARHSALSAYSHRLFSDIYRDLPSRHYLFLISDGMARLITLYSCPNVQSAAMDILGLRCGVSLSETNWGMNAIGLALRFQEPMRTSGEQPHCKLFQRWCAVAVPIMDADYEPVACVGLFNCSDDFVGEKLALVNFIARDLERFYRGNAAGIPEPEPATIPTPRQCVDLTVRQHQVLSLFAKGFGYKEIAKQLGIGSPKTIEDHLDAVRDKLQVSRRRECIHKAMALGLLKG